MHKSKRGFFLILNEPFVRINLQNENKNLYFFGTLSSTEDIIFSCKAETSSVAKTALCANKVTW